MATPSARCQIPPRARRLPEGELRWTLEVVGEGNTSHIWEDTFASDFAALVEAQKAILTLGPEAFIGGDAIPTIL